MANLNFVVSPMGGSGVDVALVLAIKLRNNGVITSVPSEIPEEDANNVILKRVAPFVDNSKNDFISATEEYQYMYSNNVDYTKEGVLNYINNIANTHSDKSEIVLYGPGLSQFINDCIIAHPNARVYFIKNKNNLNSKTLASIYGNADIYTDDQHMWFDTLNEKIITSIDTTLASLGYDWVTSSTLINNYEIDLFTSIQASSLERYMAAYVRS